MGFGFLDEWSGGVSTESKVTLYVWKSREYVALESGVLANKASNWQIVALIKTLYLQETYIKYVNFEGTD